MKAPFSALVSITLILVFPACRVDDVIPNSMDWFYRNVIVIR